MTEQRNVSDVAVSTVPAPALSSAPSDVISFTLLPGRISSTSRVTRSFAAEISVRWAVVGFPPTTTVRPGSSQ